LTRPLPIGHEPAARTNIMTDFTPKPTARVPLPLEWQDEVGFEIPCSVKSNTDRWTRVVPPSSSTDTSFFPPPLRP
jgi:hypothetical protein